MNQRIIIAEKLEEEEHEMNNSKTPIATMQEFEIISGLHGNLTAF